MGMQDIAKYARNGATLLDKQRPGWWRKINVTELKVSDCKRCVLGQLFGDWLEAVFTLDREMDDFRIAVNGFACTPPDDEEFAWAWANEINARYALDEASRCGDCSREIEDDSLHAEASRRASGRLIFTHLATNSLRPKEG